MMLYAHTLLDVSRLLIDFHLHLVNTFLTCPFMDVCLLSLLPLFNHIHTCILYPQSSHSYVLVISHAYSLLYWLLSSDPLGA